MKPTFMNRRVIRYDLSTVQHHSKNWNMKDGNMVLIAYHLLESSTGAYIEWLVNELMTTANKIEYKDARLVMLPADTITHKLDSLSYPQSLLFSSYRVSLTEYNQVLK